MLYKLYPHFVCCKEILYVFDDEQGLWSESKVAIFKRITKYSDYLHLLSTDKNGDIKKLAKSYGNTTALMNQMLTILKTQDLIKC